MTSLSEPMPGANRALALLVFINLFNYIDRYVLAAVLPKLQRSGLFAANDPDAQFYLGLLTSAFLGAYMVFSPIVGWLDGHGYRRWVILGLGVTVWSLASGSSGLANSYWVLFFTRCLVGIGEGAYGPVASAMLAEIYPLRSRGAVMALFNMAIPVGSALGFLIGGQIAEMFGWQYAFYFTYSGLLLGLLCFTRREFPRPARVAAGGEPYPATVRALSRNRSFVLCCAGMTAVTFVIGGLGAWIPTYVLERQARYTFTAGAVAKLADPKLADPASADAPVPESALAKLRGKVDGEERGLVAFKRHLAGALTRDEEKLYLERTIVAATTEDSPTVGRVDFLFGVILALGGLSATGVGGWVGERLRPRLRGAYFWVIGAGALLALPAYLGLLYAPFPLAWLFAFLTIFGLFLHVGPGFTIIANVVPSHVRATAFAVNILVIHALGDIISPPLIGFVADRTSLPFAFLLLSGMIALGGVLWLAGVAALEADTARAEAAELAPPGAGV